MKNNDDNPNGYFHKWYNWENTWGFRGKKCNPLKN